MLSVLIGLAVTASTAYALPQVCPDCEGESRTTEVSIPAGASVPGCEASNQCYIPYEVRVREGQAINWSNDDTAAHTVTSGTPGEGPNGLFDSSLFMAGATFSVKFDDYEIGKYPYFCMVHPWMVGVVMITDSNVTDMPNEKPRDRPLPKTDDPQIQKLTRELNDLKNQVTELKIENRQLKNTIDSKDSIINDLRKQVESLNQILREQIKIIYEWVTNR